VVARTIGQSGKVVGVDLEPIQPLSQSNIFLLRGDISSDDIQQRIYQLLGGPANCILSDLAPKLSGIRDADMARSLELNRRAFAVATRLLRPGGALLLKSFISNDLQMFTAELKQHFATVQRTKPEATRQGSSEFYFYANRFSGQTAAHEAF
jgi:23S rRNA (uridine2552-2'-O)-methyltransferase